MSVHHIGNLLCALDLQDHIAKGNTSPSRHDVHVLYHKARVWRDGCEVEIVVGSFQVPEYLVSRQTLVHIGFTAAKASQLWEHWPFAACRFTPWDFVEPSESIARARALQVQFLALLMGAIDEGGIDPMAAPMPAAIPWPDERDPRCQLMNAWGINRPAQHEMYQFVSLAFNQKDCALWVREHVMQRFAGLMRVWEGSMVREMGLLQRLVTDAPDNQAF